MNALRSICGVASCAMKLPVLSHVPSRASPCACDGYDDEDEENDLFRMMFMTFSHVLVGAPKEAVRCCVVVWCHVSIV